MTLAQDELRIAPLGGLHDIGMNCLALEQGDDIVLIDCGTRFPNDELGVDVIHPDFRWLRRNKARLRGVFLTHGHEDHIGALPYLLRDFNVPVYGPRHALKLATLRLRRHGFKEEDVVLRDVPLGARTSVGSFDVEAIRVSHSIVEATALAIRTCAGVVVHTGDFKFDPFPSDGEVTDEARLAQLGDEGVALLLSDSTNIDQTGEAGSEKDVADELDEVVGQAEQRVFVALFSSHVQRLISLGRIAAKRGRRICVLGTSLLRHIEIAQELGYLKWPKDLILPAERARTYPRRELMVLATGTQAERGSALERLAQSTNRFLDLEAGDTVVFSSRIIPGMDRPVVTMICDLLRRGAKVIWGRRAGVHTSGHACRDEQAKMLHLVRPQAFVPVHGTLHHLRLHADLARECGVPQVDVIENGQTLVLRGGKLRRGTEVEAVDVYVGFGGENLDPELLRRRHELGRGGHLIIAAATDRRGRLLLRPTLRSRGVPFFDEDADSNRQLSDALEDNWQTMNNSSIATLQGEVQRFAERWLDLHLKLRPVVTVVTSSLERAGRP